MKPCQSTNKHRYKHTEEIPIISKKISNERAEPMRIREHKRIPKFDNENIEVSKISFIYNHLAREVMEASPSQEKQEPPHQLVV
jgi:hypothetical protein